MDDPKQDLYVYEPLKSDLKTRAIRLCHLAPAPSVHEEIRCELFNTSLNAKEDFEALSYTWGDLNDIWPVILHDKPFYVTRNLVVALANLRHTDRERVLWVDALCINQLDVLEKNKQIPLIQDVFSHGGARQVVVWLGAIPNARGAINFSNRMHVCSLASAESSTKTQERRDARARYAGKPLREQPYDDEAAHHAANRLWKYMEANAQTQDPLRYFRNQAQIHLFGRDNARALLAEIPERKDSEKSVSYCFDLYNVRETAYEAARLLWNRMRDPNGNQDLDPLQNLQPVEQNIIKSNENRDRSPLLRDQLVGEGVPAVVQEFPPNVAVDEVKKSPRIEVKALNPGKDVWDQVQKDKDMRQAARLLWQRIEEEIEEKVIGERIAEQRKEYKDENEACRNLFINAPWWSRTWILQEVIHSGKVVVLLAGEDYVTLEELLNSYGYWKKWQMLHSSEFDSASGWELKHSTISADQQWYNTWFASSRLVSETKTKMTDLRAAAKAAPIPTDTLYPPPFASLVMDFRNQEATDPHDLLYALLGMAVPGSTGTDLVVDYRLTIRELYIIAARRFLRKVLLILLWIESPERPISPNGEVPSWVPDYRTRQYTFPRIQFGAQVRFSADAGFPPVEQEPRFHQAPDEETLILRGFYVGLVTDTFDARFTTSTDSAAQDAVRLITYDRDPALRYKNRNDLPAPDRSAWERPDPVKESSWGPIHAEVGDWIIIFAGLKMPIVIRRVEIPSESGERHLFVGGCWLVESKMRGEVWHKQNWQGSGFSPIMFGSAFQDLPENWEPEIFALI